MERIKDAIQPERWFDALPRKGFAELARVEQSQPWFEVYKLPHDVYALYEPCHFQEVISYLVLGSERALLLDTGMGIGDIRKLVGELTGLPLIVVNSHTHFDHVGCNWRFDAVYALDHPVAKARLERGQSGEHILSQLGGESTWKPYPDGFDPTRYEIKPCRYQPLKDGHVFSLGGRKLTAIHTPGHSPESIMLHDDLSGVLFTGDTFYPATLYLHFETPDGMNSDFAVFRNTMKKLAALKDVTALYTSHNEPVVDAAALERVSDACERVAGGNEPFQTDENGLKKYAFDGFAIVTR